MIPLSIVLDGTNDNALSAELNGKHIRHVQGGGKVVGIPNGTQSGKASVAFIIPLEDGSVVFFETTLALISAATKALEARHGS